MNLARGKLDWTWWTFALFLAVALAIWLWPSVIGGKVLLPLDLVAHNPPHDPTGVGPVHNPLIGDMIYENYTWHEFQRQAIRAGELPLWNPYTFAGHPLYATGQASTFYPLNAIFWIVPLARAYVGFIWLHLLLGGLFAYLFCRRMGIGGFGASVGGVAFALGGFLTARLVFPMLLGSAVWLPLMLLYIDWMAEPRQLAGKFRGLLPGALLFVQPILAGFIEIAFYAYVACGLFTLFRVAAIRSGLRDVITFLAKIAAVPVLAALLAAPLLLPFFEVMKLNIRSGQGNYASAEANAVAPLELLTSISPDALGNPTERECFHLPQREWRSGGPYYFGPKNYVEVGFYFGLLPLAFLLLSPARRGRGFAFAWTLLLVALAFALVTPIYKVFYYCVPGAEQVRTPFRWLYLALFAGTFLAAIGGQHWYDRLQQPVGRTGRVLAWIAMLTTAALALAVLALLFLPGPLLNWADQLVAAKTRIGTTFRDPGDLAGFLWMNGLRFAIFALLAALCAALAWCRIWSARAAKGLSLAVLALLAFDLGQASYSFYTHSDPAILKARPPAIAHMMADPDRHFRLGRYGPDKFLYSNLSTIYALEDFGGYDSIILTDYVTFLNAIENQHLVKFNIVMTIERLRSLNSPLLPLLNLRYLMTRKDLNHSDWEPVLVEGNVKLYRIRPERELPRAFMVGAVQPAASLADAIDKIKQGTVNVFEAATVQAPVDTAAALIDAPAPGRAGNAEIVDYGFSHVHLKTSASRPALLILLDVYYPGWNAYIDGRRTEVYRADGVFRGVFVPVGAHTVEFRFEPRSFRSGVAVAGTCLVVLLLLAMLGRRGGQLPASRTMPTPAPTPMSPPEEIPPRE